MYHEELKMQYINKRNEEVIIADSYLNRLFEKTSKLEYEYDKDVSNFTFYEICDFYKTLNTSSVQSIAQMNFHLQMYTQWCLSQNLVADNQNHFLELKQQDFNNCINKVMLDHKIVSEDMIYDWVSQLQNPKDQFVLLGTFEGLRGQGYCELAKLRPSDIDGDIATFVSGRQLKLSTKLLSIIEDCIETTDYYSTSGKKEKVVPLVDRGYVIKDHPSAQEAKSEVRDAKNIYVAFKRIINCLELPEFITPSNIYESGKINMIKKNALAKGMSEK